MKSSAFKSFLRPLYMVWHRRPSISWAQVGEDIIIALLLEQMGVQPSKVRYLDIGANHPTHFSNTYSFYRKGGKGVLVEPDPALFAGLKRRRRRDVCLNVGIGTCAKHKSRGDSKQETATLYVMDSNTLNTFSLEEATRLEAEGYRIVKEIQLPLRSVNGVLQEYFSSGIDFLSLDVEGLDLAILESMDFSTHRPKVICVETLSFTKNEHGNHYKREDIPALLVKNGYTAMGETYINTIFVDEKVFLKG